MPVERQVAGQQPQLEGGVPTAEPVHRSDLPLAGDFYVGIGCTRKENSIGGPVAIALAKAGADVLIVGNNPPKQRKVNQVLEALAEVGSTGSSHAAFDMTDPEQREQLIALIREHTVRLGRPVSGVLFFPAEGLMAGTPEERLAKARALNVDAPFHIARRLTEEKLAKAFILPPSVYSQNPNVELPDEGYGTVGDTKHEGEEEVHALLPELEKAGIILAYVAAHGVEGTFNMRAIKREMDDAKQTAMLQTADVRGERRLPVIEEVSDDVVDVAIGIKKREIPQGYTRYVGIAEHARAPLRVIEFGEDQTAERLSTIYGPEAQMVDSVRLYGNGRRAIGKLRAEGNRVRTILTASLYSSAEDSASIYVVSPDDIVGHFNIDIGDGKKLEILPGIKMLAVGRKTAVENSLQEGEHINVTGVSNVSFSNPINAGFNLETEIKPTEEKETAHVKEMRHDNKPVASFELHTDSNNGPKPTVHVCFIDPEYFIEAAAQTALLAAQVRKGGNEPVIPLFAGIEHVDYLQDVPEGEEVTLDVRLREGGGFAADAVVYRADGTVAQVIRGMSGPLRDRDFMIRFIQKQLKPASN